MQHTFSVQCLQPKRIRNPYTGESLIVPCGHCKSCNLNKSQHLSLLCDLEAQVHKYVMFITLTYAPRFIPRAQLVDRIDNINEYDLVSSDGEILAESLYYSQEDKEKILNKFYNFGSVPYLRKTDLQKFLKRFRYHAKKITSERLRYFACGEYGPLHYRPHYHILLFFSSEELVQTCEQIVLASWPFGRVDVQLSRGKTSSYVAGYVNSFSTLPKIFKAKSVRPFVVHSSYLGKRFLDRQSTQIYSLPVEQVIKRSLLVGDEYREFNLFKSYYSFYFPKCKGYSAKSPRERAYSYRIYDTARKAFPTAQTPKELACLIASKAYYFGNDAFVMRHDDFIDDRDTNELLGLPFDVSSFTLDVKSSWNDLVGYFIDSDCLPTLGTEAYEKWVQRIYTELLVSRHFLYVVCDNRTMAEQNAKLKKIDEFYKSLDYLHLLDFFEQQKQYFESDLYGSEDMFEIDDNNFVPYFYQNVEYDIDMYKQSLTYRVFSSDVKKLYDDRIKHKKLNDANRIFLQDEDSINN